MPASDELLAVVAADLNYIRQEWNESVEDDALRRGSTVLRRLLVEGDLQRVWRAVGFEREPTITCSTLQPVLKSEPLERIAFASAGGARYQGAELCGAFMVNYAMTAEEIKSAFQGGMP